MFFDRVFNYETPLISTGFFSPLGMSFLSLNNNINHSYNLPNLILDYSKNIGVVEPHTYSTIKNTPVFEYKKPQQYSISESFGDICDFTKTSPRTVTTKYTPKRTRLTNYTKNTSGNYNFASMSISQAERAAANSPHLEYLTGGNGWSVSDASFVNDIKYAGKGINNFLTNLSSEIGKHLTITSALGTKNSPHSKNGSHYSATNPKIDFGGGLSPNEAYRLKSKLDNTGYFAFTNVEVHGNTAHIDAKIKPEVLSEFA